MYLRHKGRDNKKNKKGGKGGWCFCDAAILKKGDPCPVCGKTNGTRRAKKPLPKIEP